MENKLQHVIDTLSCFRNPILQEQAEILKQIKQQQKGLNSIIMYYAEKHSVSIADILNGPRTSTLVLVRAEIAKEAKRRGFGPVEIGRALDKDHSTVIHYLEDYQAPI
jgi:chromosomal replication initiation ATPase DnaA